MQSENTIAEKIRAEVVTNSSNVQFVQGFQEARAEAARIAEAGEAKLREELEAAKAKIAALQADPDYTTVYMAGVAEGKDAVAKELESLRTKLARAREALEKYATMWGARNDRETLLAITADNFGAHARAFLKENA